VATIFTVADLRQDCLDQIGGLVAHVLAVVDHQQPDPARQRDGHRLTHGFAWLLGDAQHCGDSVGHRRRIGDGGQFENPDSIREFIDQMGRGLQRQAGLTDPHQPLSV
jgi:hypothetical protein